MEKCEYCEDRKIFGDDDGLTYMIREDNKLVVNIKGEQKEIELNNCFKCGKELN